MYRPRPLFLAGILIYSVLIKVLPYILMQFGFSIDPRTTIYPWSFTPLFALGLFSVGCLRDQRAGFGLPLVIWLISDLAIGACVGLQRGIQDGLSFAFYPGQLYVYAGLGVVCCCGLWLRKRRSWPKVLVASLIAPGLFFLVSNFGSWRANMAGFYSPDLAGLLACYAAGLPFFRNQLISTALFSGLLFSPLALRELEAQEAEPDRSLTAVAETG